MKAAYKAQNPIDANIVKGLLETYNIESYVSGTHLQAVLGEVAAMNNSAVWVDDNDVKQAREIIAQWEASDTTLLDDQFSAKENKVLMQEEQAHKRDADSRSESDTAKTSGISIKLVLFVIAIFLVIAWLGV